MYDFYNYALSGKATQAALIKHGTGVRSLGPIDR